MSRFWEGRHFTQQPDVFNIFGLELFSQSCHGKERSKKRRRQTSWKAVYVELLTPTSTSISLQLYREMIACSGKNWSCSLLGFTLIYADECRLESAGARLQALLQSSAPNKPFGSTPSLKSRKWQRSLCGTLRRVTAGKSTISRLVMGRAIVLEVNDKGDHFFSLR